MAKDIIPVITGEDVINDNKSVSMNDISNSADIEHDNLEYHEVIIGNWSKGEKNSTLWDISQEYGVSIEAIEAANPWIAENGGVYHPGDVLLVPIVREGVIESVVEQTDSSNVVNETLTEEVNSVVNEEMVFDDELDNSEETNYNGNTDVLFEVTIPDNINSCANICYSFTPYNLKNWIYTQKEIYNKWIEKGSKNDRGIATIDGYYLIAVSREFGNVGDIVTVHLENGEEIKCLIGDQKADKDLMNIYGSPIGTGSGPGTNIVEWEGCVGNNNEEIKANLDVADWNGKYIAKIVNHGSYLDNILGVSVEQLPDNKVENSSELVEVNEDSFDLSESVDTESKKEVLSLNELEDKYQNSTVIKTRDDGVYIENEYEDGTIEKIYKYGNNDKAYKLVSGEVVGAVSLFGIKESFIDENGILNQIYNDNSKFVKDNDGNTAFIDSDGHATGNVDLLGIPNIKITPDDDLFVNTPIDEEMKNTILDSVSTYDGVTPERVEIINLALDTTGKVRWDMGKKDIGSGALDCSGFIAYLLNDSSVGGTSNIADLKGINYETAIPGDLIVYTAGGGRSAGHVQMYVGDLANGNPLFVDCSNSRKGVSLKEMPFEKIKRDGYNWVSIDKYLNND